MREKFLNKILNLRFFLICDFVILIAKILYSYYRHFSTFYFEDFRIAKNLALYGEYSEFISVGATAYKLPIYPLFLSFFCWLFPQNPEQYIIIVQHVIFFFEPIIIIKISNIFGREKAGFFAGFLFVFSPAYFYYSNILEVTNIFVPVFLGWIYFFLKIFSKQYSLNRHYILFGLLTAFLLLTQVVVTPLAILLVLSLIMLRKISFKKLFLIGTVSFLAYSPWIVRNYEVFDKFIPTKTPVWQNIYLSFSSSMNILDDVKLISKSHEEYTFQLRKSVNEFELEKIYKAEVLKVIKGREQKFIEKALQNAVLLWYVPSRYFYDNSPKILFGRKVYIILLNLATIFAMFYFYRRNKLLFFASLLLFLNFTAPYMIGHAANTRFKLDFEWYQFLLVGLFLEEKLKTSRKI